MIFWVGFDSFGMLQHTNRKIFLKLKKSKLQNRITEEDYDEMYYFVFIYILFQEYKPLKFDNESPSVPKETSAQHPYPYHHFTEGPAKGGDEASFILGGSSHKFPSSHDQKWKLSGGDGFEGSGGSSSHKFPSGHEQKWKLPGGDNFGGFGGGLVGGSSSHKFPSSYGQKWKLTGGETVDGLGGGLDYNKPKHKSAMKKPTEQVTRGLIKFVSDHMRIMKKKR